MSETALAGKTILVTRPAEQAAGFSELIQRAGGLPFVFPAIEIMAPSNSARLEQVLGSLKDFDLAIFVSPTAVARALECLAGRNWPETLKAAAVGQGSARALREHGINDVVAPLEQSDSEALLALPALQAVTGKRIVIFRGEGGRELMAQTLAERGASVEYAECYRRARPHADIAPLLEAHRRQPFSAMALTSREGLANLREMLGDAWHLFASVPVFVPHERIAEAARQLGMKSVHVATGGDVATLQAMIRFLQP